MFLAPFRKFYQLCKIPDPTEAHFLIVHRETCQKIFGQENLIGHHALLRQGRQDKLPQEGIILGAAGLIVGIVTILVWCKMENKKMPKINGKNVFCIIYAIVAALVLGVGMCMCLVWQQIIWGTLVGLLGIIMLIALIPMIKGIK